MNEKAVEMQVRLDKETMAKLDKKTKKDLIEIICIAALEAKIATGKLEQLEKQTRDKINELQTNLDKAEAYVEQGRAMINAIMERWYEYDT